MNIEKEHELFEAWVRENHPVWPLDRCEFRPNRYHRTFPDVAWQVWQARAAIEPEGKP